jgi:RND family efflux transporter MFP subunit
MMARRLFIAGVGLVLLTSLLLLRVRPSEPSTPPPAPPSAATQAPSSPELLEGEHAGFIGVIVAEGSVAISAKFDGRLEQVAVQVGDSVRKGDVLARLDTAPLQHELAIATADLQAARAEEEVAKLAHQSAQEALQRGGDSRLLSLGAISEEEQAKLRFAEKTGVAKLAAAQALVQSHQARVEQLRLRLSEATLRAPFDARVSMRYLDPGTLVSAGLPIVHLLADGGQQVRFAIPELLAPRVIAGAAVVLGVQGSGIRLEGRVERVSPEVDPASRMVLAIASVVPQSGTRLPPGTAVRVWVVPGAQASSVPGP